MTKRILVVDDDRSMVDTLCDILELKGWQTFRAYNGAAATHLVASVRVDVVLMDVRMPEMDGVEALRIIKAQHPATRVVLMTAFTAAELLAQAEREGALQILAKPVDVVALLEFLELATRRRPVLVVDDDPASLATIRDVLRQHGQECITARSVPEAMHLLEQAEPCAVLLDLRLNGVQADEQLVAFREMTPTALLILYSGHPVALAEAMDRVPQGMIAAAYTKPLPIPDLLRVLDSHVC